MRSWLRPIDGQHYAMTPTDIDLAHTLLKSLPVLQHTCDLDLLVFFAKHPRTLLSTEQLAQLLGYQVSEIARSRNGLLAAGLLTRTQNPTRRPRLYVFTIDGANGRSLSTLVRLASTREGLLALRLALVSAPAEATYRQVTYQGRREVLSGAGPTAVQRSPETIGECRTDTQPRGKR